MRKKDKQLGQPVKEKNSFIAKSELNHEEIDVVVDLEGQ